PVVRAARADIFGQTRLPAESNLTTNRPDELGPKLVAVPAIYTDPSEAVATARPSSDAAPPQALSHNNVPLASNFNSTASFPLSAVTPVTYTEPSALTATSGRPSPRIVVPFQILCQLNDPSGANFTTKILGLGVPNGSLVNLSVIPTTYELPSAALATPCGTPPPTPR